MSAAAILAGTGAASAGTYSFTFATIDPYCDGGTITTGLDGGIAAAWVHTNVSCTGATTQGAGLLQRVNGLGKVWAMSDNYAAKMDGSDTDYVSYVFQKPIGNGSTWTVWFGSWGVTNFEYGSGILENVQRGPRVAYSHGTRSTLAKVKQIVAGRHP